MHVNINHKMHAAQSRKSKFGALHLRCVKINVDADFSMMELVWSAVTIAKNRNGECLGARSSFLRMSYEVIANELLAIKERFLLVRS